MRNIDDILKFREDLSPFLVHLTRATDATTAKEKLEAILECGQLRAGRTYGDVHYGMSTDDWAQLDDDTKMEFFGAISLTETPLNEIHCLLEIQGRQVNLEPYGLVMLRERLKMRGVSPVLYLNNEQTDKDVVVQALCELRARSPEAAKQILPLMAFFGNKLKPPNRRTRSIGRNDWHWEREWRLPASYGPLQFEAEDVFVGLCPHSDIEYFEGLAGFQFVDPRRNMKYYAAKLIDARQRLDLKVSVV